MPLTCPVDTDRYSKSCAVPLFPGTWNYWLLSRTLDDGGKPPSDAQTELERLMGATALQRATGVRGAWGQHLGDVPPGSDLSYVVDHVKVYDLSGDDYDVRGRVDVDKLAATMRKLGRLGDDESVRRVAWRGECDPLPLTNGPSTVFLLVWYYNGQRSAMRPWPTHIYSVTGNQDCPVGTDWQLDSVYSPLTKIRPPKEDRPVVPGGKALAGAAMLTGLFYIGLVGVTTFAAVKGFTK